MQKTDLYDTEPICSMWSLIAPMLQSLIHV